MDIEKREVYALKYVRLNEEKREEFKDHVASLLVEQNIMNNLRKHKNAEKFFPEMFGIYYDVAEGEKEVKQVVMISEAGDFNLAELKKVRKELNLPYTETEALIIIKHLTEALKALKEIGVYHSDLKLKNIVFSQTKKTYFLIDFGISRLISIVESNCSFKISDIVKGGTKEYNSPEKNDFLKTSRECENFDPYRCDAWSLGKCIKNLVGDIRKTKKEIWDEIEKLNMIEKDKRKNVSDLILLFEKENKSEIEFLIENEKELIDQLELKRMKKEGFEHLYEKFNKASMFPELEKIAIQENNNKQNEEEKEKSDEKIIMKLWRLGKKRKEIKKIII